jgi:hypothetical protein
MRRTVLLMASMALTLLLASGVALAINEIRCRGGECNGTPRNDKMLGTPRRDIVYGFKGDDRLFGRDAGDDLYGFGGSDIANGGDGADKLGGSDGRDSLYGGMGPDSLNGGNNPDHLDGGPGNDEIFGGRDEYSDTFYNWDGNGGDDLLDGGGGGDWYTFWYSFSRPNAGWGHATISDSDINPDPGQVGAARDTLDFEIWWRNLTIDLSPGAGPEVTDGTGESTIQWAGRGEFYRVISGSGDDVIDAKDGFPNTIDCGEGTDTVTFDTGMDTLTNCEP